MMSLNKHLLSVTKSPIRQKLWSVYYYYYYFDLVPVTHVRMQHVDVHQNGARLLLRLVVQRLQAVHGGRRRVGVGT